MTIYERQVVETLIRKLYSIEPCHLPYDDGEHTLEICWKKRHDEGIVSMQQCISCRAGIDLIQKLNGIGDYAV